MWRKRPAVESADDGTPDLPGMPPRDQSLPAGAPDVLVRATDGHPRRRGHGSGVAEGMARASVPPAAGRSSPTPTARALGLLARREHSRRELHAKLLARGVTASEATAAIDQLGQAGWQSDLRYAESLYRQRRGAGYGPRYIAAELQARGVASAMIAQAMTGDDGRDWVGIATELLQRRLGDAPRDADLRQRALALLLRRGFDNAQAREAYRRWLAG